MSKVSYRGTSRMRGSAVLLSMIIALVCTTLGLASMSMAMSSSRLTYRRSHNAMALSLATAGAEQAVSSFKSNPNWLAPGQTAAYTIQGPHGGTVSLACTETNNVRHVTSVGTVIGSFGSISRTIRVAVYQQAPVPPFHVGISAKSSLTVGGGTQTTSSPIPGAGGVHSNGDLTLSGSGTRVDGDASASGIVSNGGVIVVGATRPNASPLLFPDIDFTFASKSLEHGTTPGNRTLSGGAAQLVQGKYTGDVTVSGAGCTIPDGAVVWITGKLSLDGPIRGRGTVIVNGKITASGGSYTQATNVLFVGMYPRTETNLTATAPTQDAISLGGGSTVYGYFYAPYAKLSVSGGTSVFGGISALAVALTGSSVITVPNDNRTLPPAPSGGGQGWEEL